MYNKNKRMCHYASDKRCAGFSPENVPKAFGGRAPPGPIGGAYNAPPDLLAGFKVGI